ncbi:hypothetical protein CSC81_10190 [Tenacibaculum discolor]|uniref:Uncharacterized protein n=1 Tax=Tenacibaculum discolor TaxID=361581 RepID=A0A2G1BTR6_9FLAO|nr:hypothetical protein [Tenacibaculum discolor]MDP2541550.1 hypothetical protein [Tenacibaculum discolor]PHN97437.1 hypothetical protein CSC81_10190 [Tenacibaculum discolor]
MKKILLLLLISTTGLIAQSNFDRGYEKGYKEGFCYQVYGCLSPIPPIPPLPNINERNTSFKDGYQRGFLDGNKAKSDKRNNDSFNRNATRKYPNYIEPFDFALIEKGLKYKQQRYDRQKRSLIKRKEADLYRACQNSIETYNKTKQFLSDYKDKVLDLETLESVMEVLYDPTKIINKHIKRGVEDLRDADLLIYELKENDKMIKERVIAKASEIVGWFVDNPNTYMIGTFKSSKKSEYSYDFESKQYKKDTDIQLSTKFLFEKNMLAIFYNDKAKVLFIGLSINKIKKGKVLEDGHGGIIVYDKKKKAIYRFFDRDIKTNQFKRKTTYHNLIKL